MRQWFPGDLMGHNGSLITSQIISRPKVKTRMSRRIVTLLEVDARYLVGDDSAVLVGVFRERKSW